MFQDKPVLSGRYTKLRPLAVKDADKLFSALGDLETKRLTGTHQDFSLNDVKAHCASVANARDRWDYVIEVEGELVGDAALTELDTDNSSASFRIAVWSTEHRNRGIGTEATKLLIGFGFQKLKLHRIELEVFAFNPRARKVYENVGFRFEGTRRHALQWEGEWIDATMMAMLSHEFQDVSSNR